MLSSEIEQAGWAAGLRTWLAHDAVYLPPDTEILKGERAIRAYLRQHAPDPAAVTTVLHREAGGASADGELGYTFGWSEATDTAGAVAYGKYLAAWKRHGHRWRVAALLHRAATAAPSDPPADSPLLTGYHGTPRPHRHGEPRHGLFAADRAFAAQALAQAPTVGYGPSFVDWADPNAVVFGNRNFYWGIDWVKAIYPYTVAGELLTWEPSFGDAAGSGDLGWTVRDAGYHYHDPTVTIDDYSKYLTVWARQPDGGWRWLLDDGNERPAPAP